ncbi:MAG TPA: hypothetical protein VLT58_11760, partial [Polyangia bacterium]|nr:hypothetical protein [Polyangia bacterium]
SDSRGSRAVSAPVAGSRGGGAPPCAPHASALAISKGNAGRSGIRVGPLALWLALALLLAEWVSYHRRWTA